VTIEKPAGRAEVSSFHGGVSACGGRAFQINW
jgi:hypothetical protein